MTRNKHFADILQARNKKQAAKPHSARRPDPTELAFWRTIAGAPSYQDLRSARDWVEKQIRAHESKVKKPGFVYWGVHAEMMAGATLLAACKSVSEYAGIAGRPLTPESVKTLYMKEAKKFEAGVAGMFIPKRPNQKKRDAG